jgi:hypothetical protein
MGSARGPTQPLCRFSACRRPLARAWLHCNLHGKGHGAQSCLEYRRLGLVYAAQAAGDAPHEPQDSIKVLPRLREKDPFKILGIPNDSDFEEVQAARNYLIQEYQEHEASREKVELAYERIVNESFRRRQRKGYRPGRGKRGGKVAFDVPPTWSERLVGIVDKGVTAADAARDMLVFGALGVWAAFAFPFNAAPMMLTLLFAVFRTTNKRTRRNPEGPFFGGSAVFGAVLTNLLFIFVTFVLGNLLASSLPVHELNVLPEQVSPFLSTFLLGPFNVWSK